MSRPRPPQPPTDLTDDARDDDTRDDVTPAATPAATPAEGATAGALPQTAVQPDAADLNRPRDPAQLERALDAQLARFIIDGPQLKPALLDHFRKQPPSKAAAELAKRTSASLRLKGHDLIAERSASPSDYLKALAVMFNDAVASRSLDRLQDADAPAYPQAAMDAVQKRLASGAAQVDVSTLLSVAALPFAHQGQVERPKAKLLWRVQSLRVTWNNNLPEPYRVYYQMLARRDLDPTAARAMTPEALDGLAFARFAAEAAEGALSLPLEAHLSGALSPPHPGAATWWSDSDAPPDAPDVAARDWYAAGFVKLGFKPKDLSLRSPTVYDALAHPEPQHSGRRWISTDAVSFDKAARVGLLKPAAGQAQRPHATLDNTLPPSSGGDLPEKSPPPPKRRARPPRSGGG